MKQSWQMDVAFSPADRVYVLKGEENSDNEMDSPINLYMCMLYYRPEEEYFLAARKVQFLAHYLKKFKF